MAFPEQPQLRETLWLLLPEGRVLGSATARLLIRILRDRVEKAEEELLGDGEITEDHDDTLGRASSQSGPGGAASRFYAPTA
jgi:hypothetical protein